MRDGMVIQILLCAYGMILFVTAVASLIRKKMSVGVVVPWGVVAVVFMAMGIFIRPDSWKSYISIYGLVMIVLIFLCVTYVLYLMSTRISELSKKNNELSIQVSILNTESEELRIKVKKLENRDETNEKDSVRN